MIKNMRKFLASAVSAMLCVAMLIGILPIAAASADVPTEYTGASSKALDFSLVGSESNLSLSAAELARRLFGESFFSAEELAYMDEKLLSLTYNASISSDLIKTVYDKESGTLSIYVTPYTYTGANGTRVSWIPKQARLDLEGIAVQDFSTSPDEGGIYSCRFEDLYYVDDNFDLEVDFSWSVAIAAEAVSALLLQSRVDGAAAERIMTQYAETMQNYQSTLDAYRAYVKYGEDMEKRIAYERELAEYTTQKAVYDLYLQKKLAYDTQLKNYQDYLKAVEEYEIAWKKYEAYKDFLEKYGEEYSAYLIYRQKYDAAVAKLRVMESLFVSDSHSWQVYSGIMGSTVDFVLSRKDELAKAGYTKGEQAASATYALRPLLKEYHKLRNTKYKSDFEKNKVLYAFYCENYQTIKVNFGLLYDALLELYADDIIIGMIENEGKGAHFRQFLGQLYITSCCLDDREALALTWTLSTKTVSWTLSQLVEEKQILKDNVKAEPSGDPYPEAEVPRVEPEEVVPYPGGAPEVVYPPEEDAPEEVEEPIAPTFVAHPGDAPPYVAHPGEAPAHGLSEAMVAWASLYQEVDYEARQALIWDRSLTLSTTVSRPVSIENKFRIAFYDYDGRLLAERYCERGERVTTVLASVSVPKRASSAQYQYDFSSWKLRSGGAWTEATVTTDVSLVATYQSNVRQYRVSWVIDGELFDTQVYYYGQMPEPGRYIAQEKILNYQKYVFSGWDTDVKPVTGDVTYTASYLCEPLYYTVTWVLDNGARVEREQVLAGSRPEYRGEKNFISNSMLYTFSGWRSTVTLVNGDVTYEAKYGAGIPFSYSDNGSVTEVEYRDGILYAQIGNSTVSLLRYGDFAEQNGCDVMFVNGNASVLIRKEALAQLLANGCDRISFSTGDGERGTFYTLAYHDVSGERVSIEVAVTLLYRYQPHANSVAAAYRANGSAWTEMECSRVNGVLRVDCVGTGDFWLGVEHYLRFVPNSFCNTLTLPVKAPSGMMIDLSRVGCVYGYEVTGATLIFSDGSTEKISKTRFAMPLDAVSVELTVERIVYRYTFVVNGKTVATQTYFRGEEILLPSEPTLELDDGYIYSFVRWVPDQSYPYYPYLTLADGASRDVVVTAEFIKSMEMNEEKMEQVEENVVVKRIVLVASIALSVIAVAVLLIVFRKKWMKLIFRK